MRNLLSLFLLALGLRIGFALLFQFDGLYGQDPFAYFEYTLELRQAIAAGQPPPPFFWPIGYPLLAVLGTIFVGLRPLAGQMVSILAGSLIAPLVYLIVLEIGPQARQGGWVAGLLATAAAQLMLSSLSYMADAAGLAWLTLSALFMLRYTRTMGLRWLALAAVALGWAVLTRWAFALAAFPWALAAALAWHRAKLPWSQRVQAAGLAVLVGGLILGSQFLPGLGRGELAHTGDLEVVGWNPANAFKSTTTNSDGTFHYERPVGLFYALPLLHPAFVFPLLTPFLVAGVWTLGKRPRQMPRQMPRHLPQAALLLGWPLLMYLFLAGIAWQNPRFSLGFFPPLAVLTGLGLQTLWNRPPQFLPAALRSPDKKLIVFLPVSRYHSLLLLYLTAALLGSLAWSLRDISNFTAVNNTHIAAAQWVEEQLPPDAAVITFGVSLTMEHRTGLAVHEIYHLDANSLAELLAAHSISRSPLYLFLDLDNINSQWQGKSPQQNYQWLTENTLLTEIGRYPPYTLFQVSPTP